MRHALALGRRGLGRTWPNPAVGCVIVAPGSDGGCVGGRVVGRGWTQPGGRPHAETLALAQAGPAARGATAFVTLEPCSHHGVTPPCADALVAAGIGRVVAAMVDPDPRVAGRGLARLRAAGVTVDVGTGGAAACADHAGFLARVTRGRPLLTLKLALSLDGRIAARTGASRWITGPAARRAVHAMRLRQDAVLVGGGTARADDPMLTVRDMGADDAGGSDGTGGSDGGGDRRQPVRVVLSRAARLPFAGRLARSAHAVPLWLVHGPGLPEADAARWSQAGARLIACADSADGAAGAGTGVDPTAALEAIAAAGLTRVLCEGGGGLAASLLRAGLIDRLVVFSAGLAIGSEGLPAIGPLELDALDAAPRLALHAVDRVGDDVRHEWRRSVPG